MQSNDYIESGIVFALNSKNALDKDRFLLDLKDLANDPEALSSKIFKDAGTIKRAKEKSQVANKWRAKFSVLMVK